MAEEVTMAWFFQAQRMWEFSFHAILLEANVVFYLVLKQYVLHFCSDGRGGYNGLILSGWKNVRIFFLCYVTWSQFSILFRVPAVCIASFSGGRGGYNGLILSGWTTVSIFFPCHITWSQCSILSSVQDVCIVFLFWWQRRLQWLDSFRLKKCENFLSLLCYL
jgi:hypothetical protein